MLLLWPVFMSLVSMTCFSVPLLLEAISLCCGVFRLKYTQLPQDGLVNQHWKLPAGNRDLALSGSLNVKGCDNMALVRTSSRN